MNQDEFHPNRGAGLQAERLAPSSVVALDGRARRRLVARALLVVVLFGSVGAGVLADLALRWLGLRWPPVFTLMWGIGALLLVGVAWTRLELSAAAERATPPRQDD
jgi:hypothetical protein